MASPPFSNPAIERYETRRREVARAVQRTLRTSRRIANLRLALFVAVVALVVWAESVAYGMPQLVAAGLLAAAFLAAIRLHAKVKARVRRAHVLTNINEDGIRRVRRDWAPMSDDAGLSVPASHPYAADLDILGPGSLFALLGTVRSGMGRRTLRRWLLAPAAPDVISQRQVAVDELRHLRSFREGLELEARLQDHEADGLEQFLQWAEEPPVLARRRALHGWALVTSVAAPVLLGLHVGGIVPYALWLLPIAANVSITAYVRGRVHAMFDRAGSRESAFQSYARMIEWCASHTFTSIPLTEATGRFGHDDTMAHRELSRLHTRLALADVRFSMIYPVLQGLLLWDLHVLAALDRWRGANGTVARRWLQSVGDIEALCALATLADDHPDWCRPQVTEDGAVGLTASGLGHPLLREDVRVVNDVTVGPRGTFLLVTGSNMSGKSTLLRAIGVNAVLAQAGGPACCTTLTCSPARVYTSMRTQDSLERGVSSFMASLERLKVVVDAAREGERAPPALLFLLDEILQGTNSAERMTAVRGVVSELVSLGAVGAISTHDLALADAPELHDAMRAVHFSETLEPGRGAPPMTFDYTLRPGVATSRNALRLMELMGLRTPAPLGEEEPAGRNDH